MTSGHVGVMYERPNSTVKTSLSTIRLFLRSSSQTHSPRSATQALHGLVGGIRHEEEDEKVAKNASDTKRMGRERESSEVFSYAKQQSLNFDGNKS